MSKILALDQATRISGWAVFDDGQLVSYGKLTASHSDVGDRLHYIRQEVSKLINDFQIDEVVFEDIQLQGNVANNVATFKALAEVFGVLYELFVDLKLPRTAVLSTVWKSSLGIKGYDRTAQKKAAQELLALAKDKKLPANERKSIKKIAVFLVNMDEILTENSELAGQLFNAFDMSVLPFLVQSDSSGKIVRRYFSLLE
jgi:Holliday junction resolvasome RuvABC endonuclease subunit